MITLLVIVVVVWTAHQRDDPDGGLWRLASAPRIGVVAAARG